MIRSTDADVLQLGFLKMLQYLQENACVGVSF